MREEDQTVVKGGNAMQEYGNTGFQRAELHYLVNLLFPRVMLTLNEVFFNMLVRRAAVVT